MSATPALGAPSTGMSATARSGFIAGVAAYTLWGFLPLYFKLLGHTDPAIVVAHRIVWSAPTAVLLVAFAGKLPDMLAALASPKTLWPLLASAAMIAINWTVYIWAVSQDRVLEGSLGYFINPLVTFVFAAVLFGERFSKLQLVAIGLALLGVLNQAVVVGQVPWVSLTLAVSFAIYSVIRKRVAVDSRIGFGVEAMWLAPLALGFLLFFRPEGSGVFAAGGVDLIVLLVAAGPITAAPLILFAFGARRLRLSTIGFLQYLAPSMQFFIALALGEPFTPGHAVTFGLIWLGVALFTVSAWRSERRAQLVTAD